MGHVEFKNMVNRFEVSNRETSETASRRAFVRSEKFPISLGRSTGRRRRRNLAFPARALAPADRDVLVLLLLFLLVVYLLVNFKVSKHVEVNLIVQ